MSGQLWAIVLAAGEGRRLSGLTMRLYGAPVPKQFAVLRGEASLLQETVERLLPLVPAARIVVVVPSQYEELATEQLGAFPGIHILPQPHNRGTGPGILLPLAYVLSHDPDATVCICPSDHTFGDPEALRIAIRRAVVASRSFSLVVLGARPTRAETEYGWMRVARGDGRYGQTVQRFVEKPEAATAERLLHEGALWNTFVMVGWACAIWDAAAERMPEHAEAIESCLPFETQSGRAQLDAAYATFEERNFSRDVLEADQRLCAIELADAGWCDLGSPERVYDVLARTGELAALEARLG